MPGEVVGCSETFPFPAVFHPRDRTGTFLAQGTPVSPCPARPQQPAPPRIGKWGLPQGKGHFHAITSHKGHLHAGGHRT